MWRAARLVEDRDPQVAWLPALALAAIVLAMLLGWWLFPRFQDWMHYNDCIASGQTAC